MTKLQVVMSRLEFSPTAYITSDLFFDFPACFLFRSFVGLPIHVDLNAADF